MVQGTNLTPISQEKGVKKNYAFFNMLINKCLLNNLMSILI